MTTMDLAAAKDELDAVDVQPGTWSWWKEWTGYLVTVLPYVSAGIVLIPSLSVWTKGGILLFFAVLVIGIRVVHEKAGIEITGKPQRKKKPRAEKSRL